MSEIPQNIPETEIADLPPDTSAAEMGKAPKTRLGAEAGSLSDEVVMSARGISKIYGATRALRSVDFDIHRGKVTVLLGENGAGKSTLMKIMSGVEQPTAGTLILDGQEVTFGSPTAAVARGVAIIHQELNLCPNLTVYENIFLGREITTAGQVDKRTQIARSETVLQRLEEPINPRSEVGELSLGQQQLVEIARALDEEARVLIMDEPTSALSAAEVEVLFRVIRDLTAKGVSVVYISHHLDECLEIGDFAVVLRDGAVVAQEEMANVDIPWMVTQMVGRKQSELYSRMDAPLGEPVLEIENLIVADPSQPGRIAVRDLSLTVRAGEVVGIYGLMGAGRTELCETIAGRNRPIDGSIRLLGHDISRASVPERISRGMFLVPESRQADGLVQGQSVGFNLALSSLGRFKQLGMLSGAKESNVVLETIRSVGVKAASPKAPIESLSGGNQQKVVVGKALMTEPRLLVLDEPTRGIDVGAKADIFSMMSALAHKGLAVLYATSEVAEAVNASSRILVMSRGRLVADFSPEEASQAKVLAAADDSGLPATPEGATA